MCELDLRQAMGEEQAALVTRLGEAAQHFCLHCYLVGGAVRDLLLRLPVVDLDLMLEGSAADFAAYLKKSWAEWFPQAAAPARLIVFSRYGTAKLQYGSDVVPGLACLDFASARSEQYPESGKPPVVSFGDLYTDLARRDFTINALAVDLMPRSIGTVRDFFSGRQDLKAGVLRILHENSFVDDPARLIRGVRFAARFGFEYDALTLRLFSEAVNGGYLKRLPPNRLFDEFRKALCETDFGSVLEALGRCRLLEQISPKLVLSPESLASQQAESSDGPVWPEIFCRLLSAESMESFAQVVKGFKLQRPVEALLMRTWKELEERRAY